jgi:hypothetical protein
MNRLLQLILIVDYDLLSKHLNIYTYKRKAREGIKGQTSYCRTMPNYSNSKIYKILNHTDDKVYVGSTVEPLSKRMTKHRHEPNRRTNYELYQHMNTIGVNSLYMELIENYECSDIYELRAKEGEWIRKIGTLNKVVAGRTKTEWYIDNTEQIKERMREYNLNNKEQIQAMKQQYYNDNQEHFKQYRLEHKEHNNEYNKQYREQHKQHLQDMNKQYRENNKERLNEYNKQYVEARRESIRERGCKIVKCECGISMANHSLRHHRKTTKHQQLMNETEAKLSIAKTD